MTASRSSPSSSGSNLLKSGRIQVGATNCTKTVKTVVTPQHATQAHGPAASKSHRIAARSGPPSTAASTSPLSVSTQNVRGVVLLKPKRSSMTKVEYQRNGMPSSMRASPSVAMKTSPPRIGPSSIPRTTRSSHAKPPANQKTSSTTRWNAAGTRPKRVRTRVYSCERR